MSVAPSGLLCGVWPGHRGLIAAVVDEHGTARPPHRISTSLPEDRCALLDHIDSTEGLDWQLVLPEWLAKEDLLAQIALAHGTPVWMVPSPLVETVSLLGRSGQSTSLKISPCQDTSFSSQRILAFWRASARSSLTITGCQ